MRLSESVERVQVTEDGDFDGMTLCDTVVLEIDDAGGGHLNGSENGDHFEDAVVETRGDETVVLFIAAPEIGAAHETGDVQDDDPLQTGQRYPRSVALQQHPLFQVLVRFLNSSIKKNNYYQLGQFGYKNPNF